MAKQISKVQIRLTKAKETPGTVVFASDVDGVAVRQLYIAKGKGFDQAKVIELTIEAVEGKEDK